MIFVNPSTPSHDVKAPLPTDEATRLQRLREFFVLDTAPEPLFDNLTRMAADICGTPIALLSLVDEQRQWFKSNVGLPGVRETSRDTAFCAHAILDDQTLVVPDAMADARFADNPLVTSDPDIRFYAGVPLVLAGGVRLGTLCVIDRRPGSLSTEQERRLRELAQIARDALVMRSELIHRALLVRSQSELALERSERQYRRIVDEQSELVSLAQADGTLTFVNPAYARHYGMRVEDIVGRSLYDFVAPGDRDAVRAQLQRIIEGQAASTSVNRTVQPDGQERWVAWTNTLQVSDDGRAQLHSVGRDITQETLARQDLTRQTTALRAVIEAQPALLAVVGADGLYREVNTSFAQWSGRSRAQIVGHSMHEVLRPEELAHSMPWIARVLAGEAVRFEKQYPSRRGDRHISVHYVPFMLDDGTVDGFIAIGHDITRHKREAQRLQNLSHRDSLTGLLNRAGLDQFLKLQRQRNQLQMLALLYIDLDHFKPVNDTHGHAVGDALLKAFAARLEGLVRPTDAVARIGGDEFVIALTGVQTSDDAQAVGDKVIAAACAPFCIDAFTVTIGASVGVAFDDDPGSRWLDLLESADEQLYQAKRAGRGRLAAGDPDV